MARILLISDNEASGILWCASAGGHQVLVVGLRSRNPTVALSPRKKRFLPLPEASSFEDLAGSRELAETIADLARKHRIQVIVPSSFESLKFCVLERLRLEQAAPVIPLSDLETIGLLDDKYRFFRFCQEQGFPHPTSLLLESRATLETQEFAALTFPLLTKPPLGVAEVGIERFERQEDLRRRVESAGPEFFPALLQEWFDGTDIDFNGYALAGETPVSSVMQTTRFRAGNSDVRLTEFVRHPEVSRLGVELVRAARFTGPLNVDLRIRKSDQKVFFIEVNPRFWGRSVTCLIDGLNFVDAGIRLAADPAWRATSRCDGTHWTNGILALVVSAARGDAQARRHLSKVSRVQFEFQAEQRALEVVARLRGLLPG